MQEATGPALRPPWAKWITSYYLATPLFVLLDLGFGANLRALALESLPGWKLAYYGLCLTCGVVGWRGLRLALPLDLERLANFAIAGSIWTAAFYSRISDLGR